MLIFLLLTPLLVVLLARRWKWINTISPMTVLYAIGLLVANFLPLSHRALSTNETIQSIAVPLAIPLMLMGCQFSGWSTRHALKVFLCGLFSVLIVTIAGFFIFCGNTDKTEFAQISAVSLGIYTGGIPNMGAIAEGVGLSGQNFLYLSSYDLILTGLYLIFVIFFGKRLFRRLLPFPYKTPSDLQQSENHPNSETIASSKESWKAFFLPGSSKDKKTTIPPAAWVIGLTLLIVLISLFLAKLCCVDGVNMTVLILCLTTLSIFATFLPPIKKQQQSFSMGLYCVYVFCLSIASSCNIREMDLLGSLNILAYIGFVIFGSLVLQIILARLLKIDGDSVLVCSVALINSPPFVPLVAALLNNKDIVILGISIGLLGYLLGNYIGILLYHLLVFLS